LNRLVDFHEIWYGGNAIQGDLKAIILNPVASIILKLSRFKVVSYRMTWIITSAVKVYVMSVAPTYMTQLKLHITWLHSHWTLFTIQCNYNMPYLEHNTTANLSSKHQTVYTWVMYTHTMCMLILSNSYI
jgi:hypothetical protein